MTSSIEPATVADLPTEQGDEAGRARWLPPLVAFPRHNVESSSFDIHWSDDPVAIAETYGSEYARLKAECERRVGRWRWASKIMYDPRPLGVLLEGGGGRWLTQKSKGIMPYEYGLAPAGEFLVERISMGHHYREQFFYYSDERVVSFSYPYDFKMLAWVCVTRFRNGRAVSHSRYSPHQEIGRLEEQYDYAQGLLRRSRCRSVRCGYPWEYEYHFRHDEEGTLTRVESEYPGGGEVVYEKRRR